MTSLDRFRQDARQRRVAIVGSGPGGLVAAKYLKEQRFEPTIFEQADGHRRTMERSLPQQWHLAHHGDEHQPPIDLLQRSEPSTQTALFLSNEEILSYLLRYADRYGLFSHLRLSARVELIERSMSDATWKIRFRSNGSEPKTETFPYAVAASGRFNKPFIPPVPGLESFSI